MITGFNTDVDYNGKVYHVQTEDKGLENPHIESLIYMGGAIIFAKRTDYKEKLIKGITEKEIRGLMENQHRTLIAAIKRGRMDAIKEEKDKAAASGTPPQIEEVLIPDQPIPARGEPSKTVPLTLAEEAEQMEEKSLDEVILEYLSTSQEKDQLELIIPDNLEFHAGQKIEHVIKVSTTLSGQPVDNVPVEVRIMTTFLPKPLDVFNGISDKTGKVTLSFNIPAFTQGAAAVVILARSRKFGNAEFKKLVMKKN